LVALGKEHPGFLIIAVCEIMVNVNNGRESWEYLFLIEKLCGFDHVKDIKRKDARAQRQEP
jgi:hypothetical protein